MWEATTQRYVDAYERLTGQVFEPGPYPVEERLRRNVRSWLEADEQEEG